VDLKAQEDEDYETIFKAGLQLYLRRKMTYEANKEKATLYFGCNVQSSCSIRFRIDKIIYQSRTTQSSY